MPQMLGLNLRSKVQPEELRNYCIEGSQEQVALIILNGKSLKRSGLQQDWPLHQREQSMEMGLG